MAHEELKKHGKGGHGEKLPGPKEYAELYNDLRSEKPTEKLSLPQVIENAAAVNALADILVEDGVIKDKDNVSAISRIDSYTEIYGSVLSALIMILKEDGLIRDLEEKLEDGIIAAHRTMTHFGTRLIDVESVIEFRQETYKAIRRRRRQRNGD